MEPTMTLVASVKKFLRDLVGRECWASIAGAGTGSMISFKFGDKVPRKRPLSNLKLPPEVRKFDGEFTVFVKGGADWTVTNGDQLVCSSNDSNEEGGTMLFGLSLLVGRPVMSAKVSENLLEIELNFDGNMSFQMKCRTDRMDGYFLLYQDETVAMIGGPPSTPTNQGCA